MKKVLVVDDSQTARTVVASLVAKAGHAAIEAEDGVQGYERCLEHPDVALVISDLNMPNANGIDLVKKVMSDDRTKSIPVVILTSVGKGDAALLSEAKAAGARGWLTKPLKDNEFAALIQKFLAAG